MNRRMWLRIAAGSAACVLVVASTPGNVHSMTGVEVISSVIAIGLMGGAIIGSWWSPLVVSIAVLVALLARDAIEDPVLRPGASEDTTFTRSVFATTVLRHTGTCRVRRDRTEQARDMALASLWAGSPLLSHGRR